MSLKVHLRVVAVALLALCAMQAPAAERQATHIKIAGRDVAVWTPSGAARGDGYPIIVFSHGFTGCNTQSVFLMQALASAGYLVVAPNHKDATCGSAWHPGKILSSRPQEPFGKAALWSPATYRDRYEDIEAVLNEVLRTKTFAGVAVDPERVGIAGHSLGGYTALGVAGGWPAWKDVRIKAVLALSPHCSPFVDHGNLKLNVPVMYQGGTVDLGETPLVRRPGGAFDLSSAPKYYVEFEGAGHFAWTDLNGKYQEAIERYSIAFFDRYLKRDNRRDDLQGLMSTSRAKLVSDVRVVVP